MDIFHKYVFMLLCYAFCYTCYEDMLSKNSTNSTTLTPTLETTTKNGTKTDTVDPKDEDELYIFIGAGAAGFILLVTLIIACYCRRCRKKETLNLPQQRPASHNYEYPTAKKSFSTEENNDECDENDYMDADGYDKTESGNEAVDGKGYESLSRYTSTGQLMSDDVSDTDSQDYETPNMTLSHSPHDIGLYGNLNVTEYENIGRTTETEDMYTVPNANPTEIDDATEYIEFTG